MDRKVEVPLDDLLRIFRLLELTNALFHQPLRYRDEEQVERFASENYKEIHSLYYDVVWKWLPEDVQQEIEEG